MLQIRLSQRLYILIILIMRSIAHIHQIFNKPIQALANLKVIHSNPIYSAFHNLRYLLRIRKNIRAIRHISQQHSKKVLC